MKNIVIKGARTHNLKNIDVTLPRDKLIVITGLSGSGKSSLAFDTIYAEGQRRYVESLSSYARQFLSMMEKPDIDHIEGLSPAISIEQKSTSHNPRSTVGTTTEIYDYLRLLYARVGTAYCPVHKISLEAQTVSQIVDHIFELEKDKKYALLAPKISQRKGEYGNLFKEIMSQGFTRVYVDGQIYEIDAALDLKLSKNKKHDISVVVDRFKVREDKELKQRITESVETALIQGNSICHIMELDDLDRKPILFSSKYSCPVCDYSLSELEPRLFSFNAPDGACSTCDGLGMTEFFSIKRMLVDDELSLSKGAIAKWGKTNTYNYAVLKALSSYYDFSLDAPYKKLSQKIKDIIWLGSNDVLSVRYPKFGTRRHSFEGIINQMHRRFKSTDNEKVKDDLKQYILSQTCPDCKGGRLNLSARNVFVNDVNLPDVCSMPIKDSFEYFENLKLVGWKGEVADKILKEIRERLGFLVNVGLDYLSVDRRADTLSGGENQRIRLASQIGAGLVGVMYVLDEPSIGLHQKDNDRLLSTLKRLRDLGNTVIVVEHDEDAIRSADYILDIGPRAGQHGGEVVARGGVKNILKEKSSLTGQYLSGKRKIDVPENRGKIDKNKLISIKGATGNNLKNINVDIPIGLFTCVTGVSGSGKSTLVNDTLYAMAAQKINKSPIHSAPCKEVLGLDNFDKVVDINQSPIGRTPRSNPATYTGLFTPLREMFALLPESRARGYTPGRFSFNVKGGRCEACKGDGLIKVEMHFLPDVYVPCDVCEGKRYNRETLDIRYKGHNIHEVLNMTVEEARGVFSAIPKIDKKLQTLEEVGLSYIKLGQSSTTLSGGEAQRVKLSKELSKISTGKTLYILDEPTTGLHFEDIKNLLEILHKLRDGKNTVVVIEHNLDVIKTADYIIDLGPGGGSGGGQVVATGTPEKVARNKKSVTGHYLKKHLK